MSDEAGSPRTSRETEGLKERATATLQLRPQDLGVGLLFWRLRDAVIVGEVQSGRIVLWNPAATALFGYTEEEAVGMLIEALVPNQLKPQHRSGISQYAATGEGSLIATGVPAELPAVRKDGEQIVIELSLTALSASPEIPGDFVLAMIRDATARVRLAEERSQLLVAAQAYAAQLEELARLRADFAEMIAHEFVAPLDAISLFADLFAEGAIPADQQASMATSIGKEVQLLRRLAEDTASAARAERDDFAVVLVPVPAKAMIDDVAEFVATLSDNHPVTVSADTEATILADPARIGLVLRNLVENAVRHTPAGTPITVRAVQHAMGVSI